MEPRDLLDRYIEPKYKSRCLHFEREPNSGHYRLLVNGEIIDPGALTVEEEVVPVV